MHKEFGSKGLVLVNISLDTDIEKCRKFIKDKGMDWYNVADGKGWKAELFVGHGWNSIPRKFVLDPEGKVVADTASLRDEDSMRSVIQRVMKETPPTRKGSPADAAAIEELAAIAKWVEKKDYAKAMKAYETLAKKHQGTAVGEEAAKKLAALKADKYVVAAVQAAEADKNAPKMMKMAASLVEAGKPEEAAKYYKQVIEKYPGTKYADDAAAALRKLGV